MASRTSTAEQAGSRRLLRHPAQVVTLGFAGAVALMTRASVLGLVVTRRMGLSSRLTAAAETKTEGLGDV